MTAGSFRKPTRCLTPDSVHRVARQTNGPNI
jgi:hypothetical protein